jgi:hypothetical protein
LARSATRQSRVLWYRPGGDYRLRKLFGEIWGELIWGGLVVGRGFLGIWLEGAEDAGETKSFTARRDEEYVEGHSGLSNGKGT